MSDNVSLSSSLEKVLNTWPTNLDPPIACSQSTTTSLSSVGVKSSSVRGRAPLNLTVPPLALLKRRQSSLAFLKAKKKSFVETSPSFS